MAPDPPNAAPSPLTCPWCQYELAGLPTSVSRCPECGKDTGAASCAFVEMKRSVRRTWSRVLFFGSPGIGMFSALALYPLARLFLSGRIAVTLGGALLVPVACAFLVLWLASGPPGRRRPDRAALLAVPMALGYLLAVSGIAIGVVFLLKVLLDLL